MKTITKFFIALQLLDIALTAFAIHYGLAFEANPIGFTIRTIIYKVLVIVFVSFVLEKVNFSKLVWVINGLMGLVVSWNIFVITFEFLAR